MKLAIDFLSNGLIHFFHTHSLRYCVCH